ncbi:transcription factor IIA subunit alpha [Coemansia erecta]|nr:transcription factor IIA subunit alpha [Coemansia sp. RSA 2618]KAJ2817954.1 transcription factor IIA subunit alpha [Coemansia erecta]
MSNSIVAGIYRQVIDDVVRNVQADFEGHGVDTSVLEELQRSWEAKIIQSRVASFPGEENSYEQARVHHVDHAYYQEPNINSAASLASIVNNPESFAPSAASLVSLAQSGRGHLHEDEEDRLAGIPEDPHYAHHYRNIPQNDGADDANCTQTPGDSDNAMAMWERIRDARRSEAARLKEQQLIGQLDGASDDEGAGEADEAKTEAPEDAINSDLDDTDEDEGEDDAEEIEHMVLCQYDKVTRSKNKWKCVLRDGIMLINGRDYLFQKANGDFEW